LAHQRNDLQSAYLSEGGFVRSYYHCSAIRVFAICIFSSISLVADLNQSPTISTSKTLNLDTGAIASSGGDIAFTGTSVTLQGSATSYTFGNGGLAQFSLLNEQSLAAVAPIYTQTPISGGALAVNTVFAVYTNAGHYAKILITAVSSSSLTIQFTTYGATGGAAAGAPTITTIQNNYSNVIAGMPNYGIAPGTIFVIQGTGLADPAAKAVLQSSASPGIPLTLNGASVTVTVNGVVTHPGIYYAISTGIAAVLPASTPVGSGTLTVTYNGLTSAAATLQVVQSAVGLDTFSGLPTGIGVATDSSTGALINYNTSATPGQKITLWGSGLGADPADSDTVYTSSPHAINVPLVIYIGGIQAQILYAGSAGYPGLNQINVVVPQNVQPGCGVPIVGVVGSIVSNTVTIPVASGGGVCVDVLHGIDGNTILSTGGQTSLTSATIAVAQTTTTKQTSAFASATFLKQTNLTNNYGYGLVTPGGCLVLPSGGPPTGTSTYLNAGNISITGPTGTLAMTQSVANSLITYTLALPAGFFPASGGTFTFQGTGGPDVGPFTVAVSDNNPLVWTNQSAIAAVNRSQGVTVMWTGGIPGTYVQISGGSTAIAVSATFLCVAPVGDGQFTVPAYVLEAMPAASGGINLINQSAPQAFQATGVTQTYAVAETESSISVPYN
jgi:uncharacterized protein (TIGR03437 family)